MRVLVTRPEPGASRTAARLAELGHEAVKLPLTQTSGLSISDLPQADMVAVTSVNALRFLPDDVLSSLTAKRLYAVGARTADAARAAGFSDVVEGPGDAAGMGRILAETVSPGRILYLCGRVRLSRFEDELQQAGFSVAPVETYDVSPVAWSDDEVLRLLEGPPIDAVLLYSAVAASAYRALLGRGTARSRLAKAHAFCLSRRIAEALGPVAGGSDVAAAPDEDALFALLRA